MKRGYSVLVMDSEEINAGVLIVFIACVNPLLLVG